MKIMLARAVIVFIVFMLTVYAFGLWININTQNMLRRQIIHNTHLQLSYLANNLDRELEHLFHQQVALNSDFGLRLLLLYPNLYEMGDIFTQLRRLNTRFSAIGLSSSHVLDIGLYLPNLDRITTWRTLFTSVTEADRMMLKAIQKSNDTIFLHESDLIIGTVISRGHHLTEEMDNAVSYIRVSGKSIRQSLGIMAEAYDLTIALFHSGNQIITTTSDPRKIELLGYTTSINAVEAYFLRDESVWVLRAPLELVGFELVALFPNTQADVIILPTMIGTFALFILALIIGAITFTLYVSRLIKGLFKERQASEKAQLSQLHLQITPHFLYNSFYQIYRIAKLGDLDTVTEISLKLSQYYQYITRSREDAVTLALEVKHGEDYVAIQHIRYAGRVDCMFDPIPDTCKDMKMPKLFLQPLIENAYIHGMSSDDEMLLIHVGIVHDNGWLRISVENNGTDLNDKDLKELKRKLDSPGHETEQSSLQNIRQRLILMFGEKAEMKVTKGTHGGLKIEINIKAE
ncbi:MAG: histidine kinase [Defluviitaleaceae bacterium]|nr:histidine kinase [Defluviitaleaceae bacterium]